MNCEIYSYEKYKNIKMDQNITLIIYNYLHQLKTTELKKELMKNLKMSFILKTKINGNSYKNINNIKEEIEIINQSLSCDFYKKKLYKLLELL